MQELVYIGDLIQNPSPGLLLFVLLLSIVSVLSPPGRKNYKRWQRVYKRNEQLNKWRSRKK